MERRTLLGGHGLEGGMIEVVQSLQQIDSWLSVSLRLDQQTPSRRMIIGIDNDRSQTSFLVQL